MQSDILFDNIYVGHSIEDAKKLQTETFDVKSPVEKADEELSAPKIEPETPKSPMDIKFLDDPYKYVTERVTLFIMIAQKNPIEAIKFIPEVPATIGAILVVIIATVVGAFTMGGSAPTAEDIKKASKKAQDKALDAKDAAVDAATSGADTVKSEATRRSTRRTDAAE